ncbi:hypothetical protein [Laspinema olomoucense]|nr:hypothetical protein [Laspinema sp. D3d]
MLYSTQINSESQWRSPSKRGGKVANGYAIARRSVFLSHLT